MKKTTLLLIALLLLLAQLIAGCGTTMKITPEVQGVLSRDFTVEGVVEYEGNPEYLPRIIRHFDQSGLKLHYSYHVGYGKDSIPEILPLINPLTIVGFPVASDSIVVSGQLTIGKEDKTIKSYTAICVVDKTQSLFYLGDTFSELRRKALQQVRDNIDVQLCNDRTVLEALMYN